MHNRCECIENQQSIYIYIYISGLLSIFMHHLHIIPYQHADELWISLLKSYPFLVDKPEVLEKRKQLKRREVVISAFGRHNCGKSTILNTLLGNR